MSDISKPAISERSKPLRQLIAFLVSLFVLSILALSVLYRTDLLSKSTAFEREIGKTLLQIIAVAVLGTTASLLLGQFNHEQEKRQREQATKREIEERKQGRKLAEREKAKESLRRLRENNDQFRKEILRKVNEIYSNTKRCRRLLRARAFPTPFYRVWNDDASVLAEVYDKHIEEINDSQLDLEVIAKDIESNSQAFSDPRRVIELIRPMEKYLSRVVTEYQERRPDFAGTPPSLPIRQLKELRDILGPTDNSGFYNEFIANHKLLLASIRQDLAALGADDYMDSCVRDEIESSPNQRLQRTADAAR